MDPRQASMDSKAQQMSRRERVNNILEIITRRMKCAEDENNILREAVSRTFSNGKRVEGKVEAERATIDNLLEK